MRVPSSFYLFGQKITVWISGNVETSSSLADLGMADPLNNEIVLVSSVNGIKTNNDKISQVFFHELVHHILFLMRRDKLSNDETFVDTFSALLHQALTTMVYEAEDQPEKPGT